MFDSIVRYIQATLPTADIYVSPDCGFQDGPAVFVKYNDRECMVSYDPDDDREWWGENQKRPRPLYTVDTRGGLYDTSRTAYGAARAAVRAVRS